MIHKALGSTTSFPVTVPWYSFLNMKSTDPKAGLTRPLISHLLLLSSPFHPDPPVHAPLPFSNCYFKFAPVALALAPAANRPWGGSPRAASVLSLPRQAAAWSWAVRQCGCGECCH